MLLSQLLLFAVLAAMMGLFMWGRFRHDVVALAALMACVFAGLVPAEQAFSGFGHPAVITVACVLVLSQGLRNTGTVDWVARSFLPRDAGRFATMVALMGLGATLSAFMNNVGAMALLMPIAVQLSNRLGLTHGQILMPLSFSTILGGMTTLVGTPPNLIVSGFREEAGLGQFAMFDFAPVGAGVACLGTGTYLTEVRVPEKSKAVGLTLRAFESEIKDSGAQIVGLVRNEVRMIAPHGARRIHGNDILVLDTDVDGLAEALSAFNIKLGEQELPQKQEEATDEFAAQYASELAQKEGQRTKTEHAGESTQYDEDVVLRELVVLPGSTIVTRSANDLRLRTRYQLNLLAISRQGHPPRSRLRKMKLKPGDLLMMQGPAEMMAEFINDTGCVPLGERKLRIPDKRMAVISGAIMLGAIGLVTFGFLPAAAAFAFGVLASMLLRTVPLRQIYTSIDWPVIVLLAALIPVAGAMQTTGAADLLARFLVETIAQGNAIAALAVVLITAMFLSDLMNNAATAAVLCPIAGGIAAALDVNPDGFLMAVAIGASCAFLTPIGHQNNTLILGPGGFQFGDYWLLGLPLELLVVAVSMPLLLLVWPL